MNEALRAKMENRPSFPVRAVVTGGMPYGDKELHFGHVGGMFVHADAFARFLRDRIGGNNVIFVSGTDCFGSPITEGYRKKTESGAFAGTLTDFVRHNHERQKETLDKYRISLDLFAASALGRASEIHREMSAWFLTILYRNGKLRKLTSSQFYDPERGAFLNGRQVIGRCPVAGCKSEKGYADECDLGHQYQPGELIEPRSALTGARPEMRETVNWTIPLEDFTTELRGWIEEWKTRPTSRPFSSASIEEFMEPPVVYLKREFLDEALSIELKAPPEVRDDGKSPSAALVFRTLAEREAACERYSASGIRYRTGKTLVPFRLTGNVEWGIPAPELEGLAGLTFWVWPESLWAPLSFTQAALEARGSGKKETVPSDAWREWWGGDCAVYQFIGQDNLYFYGPAQTAIFMGMNENLAMSNLVANNHILFFSKKASSSGEIKPPMADALLKFYTAEQLRAHFLGLGLSIRSVGFSPKPLNPGAKEQDADPVLKEGSLFTNVLNRAARSCFYTAQKYFGGNLPSAAPSEGAIEQSIEAALEYERLMSRCEFHQMMNLLDGFIRELNKSFSARMREAGDDSGQIGQALADAFHILRTAAVLSHPVVPDGAEMLAEYFALPVDFFSWEHIFKTLPELTGGEAHKLKFLEPRVDFFAKHESQLG